MEFNLNILKMVDGGAAHYSTWTPGYQQLDRLYQFNSAEENPCSSLLGYYWAGYYHSNMVMLIKEFL